MSLHEDMAALGIQDESYFVGDGFSKIFHMPAGTVIGQHAHKISHDSVLLIGRAILRGSGWQRELTAPAVVHMPAFEHHSVEALTPVLWACNWPNAGNLADAEELELGLIA